MTYHHIVFFHVLLLSLAFSLVMSLVRNSALTLQRHRQPQNDRKHSFLCDGCPPQTRLFSTSSSSSIRFLGHGKNAIVRPGVVLLAPAEEFHHFLRQSAVFIYAMGTDENDDYIIRGVIVDHPTPFTMGEMMQVKESGGVFDNLIYRGGDTGGESAFCLHSIDSMGLEEIGTSRLFQGGAPKDMSDPSKVKFFFNYMEFTEQELEQMLDITHQDGDAWMAVEVPPEMVLDSDYERGEAWSRLRNAIRGQGPRS